MEPPYNLLLCILRHNLNVDEILPKQSDTSCAARPLAKCKFEASLDVPKGDCLPLELLTCYMPKVMNEIEIVRMSVCSVIQSRF